MRRNRIIGLIIALILCKLVLFPDFSFFDSNDHHNQEQKALKTSESLITSESNPDNKEAADWKGDLIFEVQEKKHIWTKGATLAWKGSNKNKYRFNNLFEIETERGLLDLSLCDLQLFEQDENEQRLEIKLLCESSFLFIHFRSQMKDKYLLFSLNLSVTDSLVKGYYLVIKRIRLLDLISELSEDHEVVGKVRGSPIISNQNQLFFAIEHPMAYNDAFQPRTQLETRKSWVIGELLCDIVLKSNAEKKASGVISTLQHDFKVTAIIGKFRKDKLRRDFMSAISERMLEYRQMLHYNTWFDLWSNFPIPVLDFLNSENCLKRIQEIAPELHKRGADIQAFLIDDGWDSLDGTWHFNNHFPEGFAPLLAETKKYGAGMGAWLSPFGGYGQNFIRRSSSYQSSFFEKSKRGFFSLGGKNYSENFYNAVSRMAHDEGVVLFKFDGIGVGPRAPGPGPYSEDFLALFHMISYLRKLLEDIFINVTIGTWPSPFWLFYANSIWRGGEDVLFKGKGSSRNQWLTYRDGETYQNVILRAPLFPIAHLMVHGINVNKIPWEIKGKKHSMSTPESFDCEVWSFFGGGLNLQELYVSPDIMTPEMWDIIAEATIWARKNKDILMDSHWVLGDPFNNEVYGWRAYSKDEKNAILTLRNPDNAQSKVNSLEVYDHWESAKMKVVFDSQPEKDLVRQITEKMKGEDFFFALHPFQVVVFEFAL